jgi:transcriptional regulator GlxA family with amidase domain
MSIKEVRFQCGIIDGPDFTRAFKKRFGLTPAHFRKMLDGSRFDQQIGGNTKQGH